MYLEGVPSLGGYCIVLQGYFEHCDHCFGMLKRGLSVHDCRGAHVFLSIYICLHKTLAVEIASSTAVLGYLRLVNQVILKFVLSRKHTLKPVSMPEQYAFLTTLRMIGVEMYVVRPVVSIR